MVALLQTKERNRERNLIVVNARTEKSETRARSTMGVVVVVVVVAAVMVWSGRGPKVILL